MNERITGLALKVGGGKQFISTLTEVRKSLAKTEAAFRRLSGLKLNLGGGGGGGGGIDGDVKKLKKSMHDLNGVWAKWNFLRMQGTKLGGEHSQLFINPMRASMALQSIMAGLFLDTKNTIGALGRLLSVQSKLTSAARVGGLAESFGGGRGAGLALAASADDAKAYRAEMTKIQATISATGSAFARAKAKAFGFFSGAMRGASMLKVAMDGVIGGIRQLLNFFFSSRFGIFLMTVGAAQGMGKAYSKVRDHVYAIDKATRRIARASGDAAEKAKIHALAARMLRDEYARTAQDMGKMGELLYQIQTSGVSFDVGKAVFGKMSKVMQGMEADPTKLARTIIDLTKIFGDTLDPSVIRVREMNNALSAMAALWPENVFEAGEFGDAVKFSGDMLQRVGMSMEETMATIAAISTERGLRGGMGGRGLRRIITKWVSNAEDLRKSFGLTEEAGKDFMSFIRELGASYKNLDTRAASLEMIGKVIKEMGGTRGGPIALAFMSSLSKVDKNLAAIKEESDHAKNAADELNNSLENVHKRLWAIAKDRAAWGFGGLVGAVGRTETAQDVLGTQDWATEAARGLSDVRDQAIGVKEVLEEVTDAPWWQRLGRKMENLGLEATPPPVLKALGAMSAEQHDELYGGSEETRKKRIDDEIAYAKQVVAEQSAIFDALKIRMEELRAAPPPDPVTTGTVALGIDESVVADSKRLLEGYVAAAATALPKIQVEAKNTNVELQKQSELFAKLQRQMEGRSEEAGPSAAAIQFAEEVRVVQEGYKAAISDLLPRNALGSVKSIKELSQSAGDMADTFSVADGKVGDFTSSLARLNSSLRLSRDSFDSLGSYMEFFRSEGIDTEGGLFGAVEIDVGASDELKAVGKAFNDLAKASEKLWDSQTKMDEAVDKVAKGFMTAAQAAKEYGVQVSDADVATRKAELGIKKTADAVGKSVEATKRMAGTLAKVNEEQLKHMRIMFGWTHQIGSSAQGVLHNLQAMARGEEGLETLTSSIQKYGEAVLGINRELDKVKKSAADNEHAAATLANETDRTARNLSNLNRKAKENIETMKDVSAAWTDTSRSLKDISAEEMSKIIGGDFFKELLDSGRAAAKNFGSMWGSFESGGISAIDAVANHAVEKFSFKKEGRE